MAEKRGVSFTERRCGGLNNVKQLRVNYANHKMVGRPGSVIRRYVDARFECHADFLHGKLHQQL
jgi:hypothetical protein